jgi:PAS domain-containing protein
MKVWRKKAEQISSGRGVARAALDGASREELLREAHHTLARQGNSGRIGVWLEMDSNASQQNEMAIGFRGMVWDRGSDEILPDWAHLSVEPPLPEELLLRRKTVEQDLEALPPNPIIGLLVGLRHAMWVPIEWKEQLKGVILAGSTGRQPAISRERVESVAAELALALGVEEELRSARLRDADLGVVRRFLTNHAAEPSPEALLSNLVESCTQTGESGDGPGAAFAVIGALRQERERSGGSFPLEFRWRSGDESLTRAIENEPLASVWRRAVEARRVIGSGPEMGWMPGQVARIVAFPLESEGQLLGTLVVGLPGGATSLATLDRLEFRAVLAASALRQRRRLEEESKLAGRQQALLECISEPLLLLDHTGRITAASRGARELTGPASQAAGPEPASIPAQACLNELFCGRDREHLGTWLRSALDRGAERRGTDSETARAELHNGVVVRLRLSVSVEGQATLVLLEPLVTREASGPALPKSNCKMSSNGWKRESYSSMRRKTSA